MISKGSIYGGKLRWWHKKVRPLAEIGHTQETEIPYRYGTCLVVRVPFTYTAFYLGHWGKSRVSNIHDDDAIDILLRDAMRTRDVWRKEDGPYAEFFED